MRYITILGCISLVLFAGLVKNTSLAKPLRVDSICGENILVSAFANQISEYTQSGVLVRTVDVPYPTGPYPPTESTRDMVLDQNHNITVYNGTFDPFLSVFNPQSETWQHFTHSGWSTSNNVTYGGIATFKNFIYLTDMTTFGDEADIARGIVRFDIHDYSSQRFDGGFFGLIDLNIGQDGLLYGAEELEIFVHDPISMNLLKRFRVPLFC